MQGLFVFNSYWTFLFNGCINSVHRQPILFVSALFIISIAAFTFFMHLLPGAERHFPPPRKTDNIPGLTDMVFHPQKPISCIYINPLLSPLDLLLIFNLKYTLPFLGA